MRTFLYRWLLESDLPIAIQVLWKILTAVMCGTLVYAAGDTGEWAYFLYPFSSVFGLMCLFTKLGE